MTMTMTFGSPKPKQQSTAPAAEGSSLVDRATLSGASAMLDDDEWDDMPIVHSSREAEEEEDRRKHRFVPPVRLDINSNAVGASIDTDVKGDWREKAELDERDYTRLELDDDPEEDEMHLKTSYLFDEEKDMTPLNQMQATKELLTGAQRVAYVGLCRLVTREMVRSLRRGKHKELEQAAISMENWAVKIMGRLYYHMEINTAEQRMIEQLAEHGVSAEDLTPSLITTHTVANPEYDPKAAEDARITAEAAEASTTEETEDNPEPSTSKLEPVEEAEDDIGTALNDNDGDGDIGAALGNDVSSPSRVNGEMSVINADRTPSTPPSKGLSRLATSPSDYADQADVTAFHSPTLMSAQATPRILRRQSSSLSTPRVAVSEAGSESVEADASADSGNLIQPLPSALPGVSTSLTAADKTVTLDIRWTVLCDLFLSLVADSVYDARSRVLLCTIAEHLNLTELDVVRFERRLTDALAISEGTKQRDNLDSIDDRRKRDKKRRYVMMGAAAVGGGLVIGLSAGLLAPVIGAGLGAAFATIGVTGTTGFLAGAGGAAIITTGGVLTGANIAGRGMARRNRSVSTFRFLPLHNHKRVSCYITVPGFMSGPQDDVRLPFSVLDPVIGDVFSVSWEPEMMSETGDALKILTTEVLTQVGQQVLQATLLTALMSALQWPVMLTKLGYLIDNPWSNALDRAWSAGLLLADILMKRDIGVRPVNLIGFSLGARVIFYALAELAKHKAYGIVQDVYLMGATVTANAKTWRLVSSVVSGRFVNCYARNDWVLGYLFRATTGGLGTVAGLRPVEAIPHLENIDVSDLIIGHMAYRTTMPIILQMCGFKITRDTFDEPEDLSEMPDREIVTAEELEKRLQAKQQKKKGIFASWRKPASRTASASSAKPPPGGKLYSGDISAPYKASESDDDDLPPREEASTFDVEALRAEVAHMAEAGASTESLPARLPAPHSLPPRPASAGSHGSPLSFMSDQTVPAERPETPSDQESLPESDSPSSVQGHQKSPEVAASESMGSDQEAFQSPREHSLSPIRETSHAVNSLPTWEPYAQSADSVISFAGDDGEITLSEGAWSKPSPSNKTDNLWSANPW